MSSQATCKKAEVRQGKIYVGKLPAEGLSNEDVTDHFNQVLAVLCTCVTLNLWH